MRCHAGVDAVTLDVAGASGVAGGTAALFDGAAGSYIAAAHDAALQMASGSIALRSTRRSLSANTFQTLLSKGASGFAAGGVEIGVFGNRCSPTWTTVRRQLLLFPTQSCSSDTWYAVELRFGAGGLQLLLDGVVLASNAYSGGLQTNTNPLVLGATVRLTAAGTFVPGQT